MERDEPSSDLKAQVLALGDDAPGLDWPRLRAARHRDVRRARALRVATGMITVAGVAGVIGLAHTARPGKQPVSVVGVDPSQTGAPGPTGGPVPTSSASAEPPSDALRPNVALAPADLAKNRVLVDTASFLTAESGFAVTAQCSANACRTVVLHTSDAAQSWTVLEPLAVDLTPPANGAGPRGHVELRVIDDLHLLAVETRGTATGLQLSNDGGHTWTTPTLPGQPQPRTLSAVATHTGFWILAGSSAEGSEPLTLFRLDAGSSVASDVGSAASTGVLAAGPVTKDRAYVMDGSASLLVLDGLHRSQRALPAPCGVLTAGRDGTLILACQDGAAAGSGPKRAWMSADDGQTWKRIPDPPYASDLIELIQIAPSRLLLNTASGESSLTLTTDGGRSWNRTLTFGDGGTGISAVSFPDARNGFVVHGGPAHMSTVSGGGLEGQASVDSEGLFVTHDGGTTWTKVDISKAAQ